VPAFLLPPSPASLQNLAVVDQPIAKAGHALDRLERTPGPLAVPARPPSQGPEESDALSAATVPAVPVRPPWWQVAAAVWLAGSALMGLWILAGTLGLRRQLARDSDEIAEPIRGVSDCCCARRLLTRGEAAA
jgi:hypothetical protein